MAEKKKMPRKILSVALCTSLMAGTGAIAPAILPGGSMNVRAAEFEPMYHTFGVIGGFNNWSGDVAMTDDDGDGVYEAVIDVVGTYEFKVRADGAWEYSWGEYEYDYDRTQNSQTNCSATIQEGEKLIVQLDTTKVSDHAKDNNYSCVNDEDFDFYEDGYEYWPVIYRVGDTEPVVNNNSEISASKISQGMSVTLKGAASGNTSPYEYAYVAQSPDGKWTVLKNYSSDTSYVFTPASLGKYNIQIKVKNKNGTVKTKDFALEVTNEFVNLSEISPSYIIKNTEVTIKGAAAGGTKPYQFAYVVKQPDGKWTVLKNYSTDTTCTFKPAADGDYTVQVKAKDSKGTVKVKEFTFKTAEQYKPFTTLGVMGDFNDWESDIEMTDPDGDGIYEALVYGITGSYEFKVRADGAWDYSWGKYEAYYDRTQNSWTNCYAEIDEGKMLKIWFDTTRVAPEAEANPDSNVNDDEFNFANDGYEYWPVMYEVVDEVPIFENNSSISAAKIAEGMSVTVTGDASGNTSPYEYAYVAKAPDGKWTVLKNYSTDASFVFTPEAIGKYTVQVKIKDSKGTVKTKDLALEVTDELTNLSDVPVQYIVKGINITITAAAAGGAKPYQFAYVVKKPDGKLTVLKNYSADTTCNFKPDAEGEYTIQVKLKDSKGAVNVKEFDFYAEEQYKPFKTLAVMGDFDNWENYIPMKDDDGDGIYEADINYIGDIEFKVYGLDESGDGDCYWSKYYKNYDRTYYNYTNVYATVGECQKLVVRLDTTKVDDDAKANKNSNVNKDNFNFANSGYKYWPVTFEAVDVPPVLNNDSSVSAAKISNGMSVTIKGAASGNTRSYKYAYVAKFPNGKWAVLQNYSADDTYVFTPAATGDYTLQVKVKDSKENVKTKDFALKVTDEFVNLSSVSDRSLQKNMSVILTGSAAGGAKPYQFAYVVKKPDGKWTVLKNYSEDTSCRFRPEATGNYTIQIKAKDNKGAVLVNESELTVADDGEQYKPFTSLGVTGNFNNWEDDIPMTDDDGDGVYEAEITVPGRHQFKVRADGGSDYTWGAYSSWYGRTKNSGRDIKATIGEGQKLIVRLDTSRVCDEAKADPYSYVNEEYFSFADSGYNYWPVTFEVVGTCEQYKPFTVLYIYGGFDGWNSYTEMTDDDGDGIYEAEIYDTGSYNFSVLADRDWNYSWGAYDEWDDSTLSNSCYAEVEEGKKLIVRLDTTKVSDDAKANSSSYVNEAGFNFEAEGYNYWPVTFETVDTPVVFNNNSTISAENISLGMSVTLTGAASGNTKPYRFTYVLQDPNEKWRVLSRNRSAGTYTFTPDTLGKYKIYIKVQDKRGVVKTNEFTLNVTDKFINISEISSLSIKADMKAILRGKAAGGTEPYQFAYVAKTPDGKWTVLKNYSEDTVYRFAPGAVGDYTVQVKAKDSTGAVRIKEFALKVDAAPEQYKPFKTLGVYGGFNNWNDDIAMTDDDGDGVYEAEIDTIGSFEFRVRADKSDNYYWSKYVSWYDRTENNYSSLNATVGECQKLIVKLDTTKTDAEAEANSYSNVNSENFSFNLNGYKYWPVTVEIVDVPPVLNNDSEISATEIAKGMSVTLTGIASGNTGSRQFAFVAKGPDGKWTVLQNYSAETSYVFTPAAAGKYTLQVKVKDSRGSVKIKEFDLNVTADLVNISDVPASYIAKGRNITLKGAAAGGTAPYQFAYVVKDPDGKWTVLKGYSADTSCVYKPELEGEYTIQIKAKDSKGAVRVKEFVVAVAEQYIPFERLGVMGTFNDWEGCIFMTDSDDDGVYEAELNYRYGTEFRVYSIDEYGDYYDRWSKYSKDNDKTYNNYNYCYADSFDSSKKLIIRLDTTRVDDEAKANKDSYVNDPEFSFAKDAYKYWPVSWEVVDAAPVMKNESSISSERIVSGMSVTLKGYASGNTSPYEFAYVAKGPDGKWTVLQSYSTETSYVFTPAAAGKYTIQIKARNSKGTVEVKEFTLNVSNEFTNISELSSDSITKDVRLVLTGAAAGGTKPYQFAFVAKDPAGKWSVLKGFSADTTCIFKPEAEGEYTIQIKAKDSKGAVKVKEFALRVDPALEQYKPFRALRVMGERDYWYDVYADMKDEDNDGIYEAELYDAGEYYFRVYGLDDEYEWYPNWSSYDQDDDTTYCNYRNIYATVTEGKKLIVRLDTTKVDDAAIPNKDSAVNDPSFSFARYGYKYWPVTFEVVDTPLVVNNDSYISAESVIEGMSVTLTGAASGNTSPYEYAYTEKDPAGKWTVIKSYSSETTCVYTPVSVGKHTIQIKVRNKEGTINVKEFTLNVTGELTNISEISSSKAIKNRGVTLTGAALGGTRTYQFAFVAQGPDGKWTVIKNYSADNTCIFKPAALGKYKIQIKVKDGKGAVAVKEFEVEAVEQYIPFTSLGVIGNFNEWNGDLAMTDNDGDGIYEAVIDKAGEYEFFIRADGSWNYCWGAYDDWNDCTQDSYNVYKATVSDGQKLTIRFDTTKIADEIQYSYSDAKDPEFDFPANGCRYWGASVNIA